MKYIFPRKILTKPYALLKTDSGTEFKGDIYMTMIFYIKSV